MATVTVTHSLVQGGGVDPDADIDGAEWDAAHVVAGLENVDNTSDADKPISTATQTALDGKIDESLLTTRGDIIYRNATVPARLAKGALGTVLTMGANDPEWAAPTGGAPGGSTTQLQYNNAGAFGGIATATFNGTNLTYTADVGFTNASPKTAIDINKNAVTSPALVVATSLQRTQAANATNTGQEWVSYGGANGVLLAGCVAGGTAATPTATPSNIGLYNMRAYGYTGSAWAIGGLWIIRSAGLWSGSNQGTAHDWYTTPSGSTSIANSLTLSDSGCLIVGGTGFAADSGAGNLSVAGGITTAPPTTKTANYTMLISDSSLIFNGAGSLTLTLLSAASYPGRWLHIKTIASQTVVSASSNVVPQAGGAAGTAILAATAGKWAWLQSDGTNWQIMASN